MKGRLRIARRRRGQGGMVLFVALVISLLGAMMAVPYLFKISSRYRSSERSHKTLSARYLAEAGIERAIWELKYGNITTWAGKSDLRTMTLSSFTAANGTVMGDVDISVAGPLTETPVIVATARVPFLASSLERTLRVALKKPGLTVFDYALFSTQTSSSGIVMKSRSQVDSYNSRMGPYNPAAPNLNGNIGSNSNQAGAIQVQDNGTIVKGGGSSGPKSDPTSVITISQGAQVTGSLTALARLKELPSATPPSGLPDFGNFKLNGAGSAQTISQSGQYGSFDVYDGAQLTITGNVTLYVTGAFSLKTAASLNIADGASLKIYLDRSFRHETGAVLNNISKNPANVQIWGTDNCSDIDFKTEAEAWVSVYAPKSSLKLDSKYQLYGAIVCRSIAMGSEAKLHYDESLATWDSGLTGSTPLMVKSWQILQ